MRVRVKLWAHKGEPGVPSVSLHPLHQPLPVLYNFWVITTPPCAGRLHTAAVVMAAAGGGTQHTDGLLPQRLRAHDPYYYRGITAGITVINYRGVTAQLASL